MSRFPIIVCVFFLAMSCHKPESPSNPTVPPVDTTDTTTNPIDTTDTTDTIPGVADSFRVYTILAGANYCVNNLYLPSSITKLQFKAILDSSCIYTTALPDNQADVNKLYGFADCSTFHHDNSARFGWSWYNGQMRIHGYAYADSIRFSKELGIVGVGDTFSCSLEVLPNVYRFTLNGVSDTMLRHCSGDTAKGYTLMPYFGGDEPAPHEIHIRIREIE